MRWLILFLLLIPVVHAEIAGWSITDIAIENITLGPSGGFSGPYYLMASNENSSGSMGLVVILEPHQDTHEGLVQLLFEDNLVGVLNMRASPDELFIPAVAFSIESLHGGLNVIQEQSFSSQIANRDITGKIVLNLENLSHYDQPTLDVVKDGQKVGIAVVQRLVQEVDLRVGFTGHFTIRNEEGELVRRGIITMIINDSHGMQTEDFNYENGRIDFVRTVQNDSLVYFRLGAKYVLARHISGDVEITEDLTLEGSDVNFPDSDGDGFPDVFDYCPGSTSTSVDTRGCDCNQLDCLDSQACITTATTAACVEHCGNGVQDDDEEGVDCGQACGEVCPTPQCTPNTCVSTSKLCNAQGEIVPDCKQCGCPDSSACTEKGCVPVIKSQGLLCKTNRYKWSTAPMDCKTAVGPNAYQENVPGLVNVDIKKPKKLIPITSVLGLVLGGPLAGAGGLLGGIIGGGAIGKEAEKEVNKQLQAATVCIDTVDMGCTTVNTDCIGPDLIAQHMPEIKQEVEPHLNSLIDIPGMAKFLGLDIKLTLAEQNIQSGVTYSCPDIIFTEEETCEKLYDSGPSDKKADILVIGAGFYSRESINARVRSIMDFHGRNADTRYEGLFSIEPWKSNKHRFNVWTVPAGKKIGHVIDANEPSSGPRPRPSDAARFKMQCPQAEYTIILSTATFRSHCYSGPNTPPCAVSLNTPFPGRLFAHEFGHGFGKLADEYYNHIEPTSNSQIITGAQAAISSGPNCKATQSEAESAWSDLVGDNIGYFLSCGGDCGAECANFVRPTVNSVMNSHTQHATATDCDTPVKRASLRCQGPPFSPWFDVNERNILSEMQRYDNTFNGTEPEPIPECVDLDGYNFFSASNATGLNTNGELNTLVDHCQGNTVYEAWCGYQSSIQQTVVKFQPFYCRNGCEEGACILSNATCTETDVGGRAGIRGNLTGADPQDNKVKTVTDECLSPERALDYYCYEDSYGQNYFVRGHRNCALGCADGACINHPRTVHSLNFNLTINGTTTSYYISLFGRDELIVGDTEYWWALRDRAGENGNVEFEINYERGYFEDEFEAPLNETQFTLWNGEELLITSFNETSLQTIIYPDTTDLTVAQQDCQDKQGTFNECGSTCQPGELCAQVCVMMCEFE